MIRRSFRIGLLLGLLAGVAFALVKVFGGPHEATAPLARQPVEPWPRLPSDPASTAPPITRLVPDPGAPAAPAAPGPERSPAPKAAAKKAPAKKAPAKKAAGKKAAATAWVEPTGGVCPTSHPVKAKLASKIFHLPGMLNYERTRPDRCYADAAKAEADGLRAAKR